MQSLLTEIDGRASALDHAKRLYAARLAPAFSPFDFIKTDEVGLSSVIAWLLDPRESHSQGGRFLRSFFAAFKLAWEPEDFDTAKVWLEYGFDQGRLDIFVRFSDGAVVIENARHNKAAHPPLLAAAFGGGPP